MQQNKKIIKINQALLFRLYSDHKKDLKMFRIWFIAGHLVDINGK